MASCVCVCVCERERERDNEKKLPDEWQARQAILAVLQVAASTMQRKVQEEEARFISRSLSSLQKKKGKQFTKPAHVACSFPVSGPRSRQEQIPGKDDSVS